MDPAAVTDRTPVVCGTGPRQCFTEHHLHVVIGVEVVLNDDDTEHRHVDALEQKRDTFFATTRKTEDPEIAIKQLRRRVQKWIDAYKNEKNAWNHAKYEAMRSGIATGLDLTE